MKSKDFLKLAACIIGCELAGAIGAVFTMPAIATWYASLEKPLISPPNWLFGPAWTVLYLLMGVALFLIWRKGLESKDAKIAVAAFCFQLALNTLWSLIFFGLRNPFWALIEIIALWVAIAFTIATFFKVFRLAAFLLFPYILWVTLAMYLNCSIWLLNM